MQNCTPDQLRFLDKCQQGPCWLWVGGSRFLLGQPMHPARASWLLFRKEEPIPKGVLVGRSCRHPDCVRPDHLRLRCGRDRARYRENQRRWVANNREYHLLDLRLRGRIMQRQRRQALLTILGGRCCHCGCTDYRLLQVDHVHGGGGKHRQSFRSAHAYQQALKAQAHTGAFQLLCVVCHTIKQHEESEAEEAQLRKELERLMEERKRGS